MYTTLVDHATLQRHLDDPDWLIVDCRFNLADVDYGARAYAEGHIPGAHYLHLDHDLSGAITPKSGRHPLPEIENLAYKLNAIGLQAGQQVVAYDGCGGAMAVRIWWLLRWQGHKAVALLDGGWQGWRTHGGAVQEEVPQAEPGNWQPEEQIGFIADTRELLRACSLQLVDARTAPRFRGENEPIDPVAGRIPGARNRPLGDNLVGDNDKGFYFKSREELRAEWAKVLVGTTPHRVVHYCGSGVTAVLNQLAMEIAGFSGSRLYPGSWSEWIRDADRPVARGD